LTLILFALAGKLQKINDYNFPDGSTDGTLSNHNKKIWIAQVLQCCLLPDGET